MMKFNFQVLACKLGALLVACGLMMLGTSEARGAWVAFHDPAVTAANGSGTAEPGYPPGSNVSISTGLNSAVISLIDYSSGDSTGASISYTGSGFDGRNDNSPSTIASMTPAHDIFGDILNTRAMVYLAGGTGTFTVSGLQSDELYDFVLYVNRGAASGRYTRYTLNGADSYVNASSAGTFTTMEDGDSVILHGAINADGDYVRFTDIAPGSDGQFSVFLDGPVSSLYSGGNSFKYGAGAIRVSLLAAEDVDSGFAAVPEPSSLALLGLSGVWLLALRRRVQNGNLYAVEPIEDDKRLKSNQIAGPGRIE